MSLIAKERAMPDHPKQASSATTAVLYITAGALMTVWSTVTYFYLVRHDARDFAFLWCYGFFFSGLVLIGIGITLGRIGRAVRYAEVSSTPGTTPVTGEAAAPISTPSTNQPPAPAKVVPAVPPTATPITTVTPMPAKPLPNQQPVGSGAGGTRQVP
jgi:hypothetical protein